MVKINRRVFLGVAVAVALLFGSVSLAKADELGPRAEEMVKVLVDKALTTFRTVEDKTERHAQFRQLLNDGFDVRAIGKWSLGRYWRKVKPEQKEEYFDLFENFIVATYSNRFEGYAGKKIDFTVLGSQVKGDTDAVVTSNILEENATKPVLVEWRIKSNKEGELKVVDLYVERVSLGQKQRSEFASVIKNSGGEVDGLLEILRSKVDELAATVNKD